MKAEFQSLPWHVTIQMDGNGEAYGISDVQSNAVIPPVAAPRELIESIVHACNNYRSLVKEVKRIQLFAFDAPELKEFARIALANAGEA